MIGVALRRMDAELHSDRVRGSARGRSARDSAAENTGHTAGPQTESLRRPGSR